MGPIELLSSDTASGRVVARSTLHNLLGVGLPLLVAVVAIPILARRMGFEAFGLLGMAWLVLSYAGELGFGRATTRFGLRPFCRSWRMDCRALIEAVQTWRSVCTRPAPSSARFSRGRAVSSSFGCSR